MKLSLSKIKFEGEWYDFGDGKLLIRPIPMSRQRIRQEASGITETLKETFFYCLLDWQNFFDENDQPMKLTEEIKEKLFESNHAGIRNFVMQKNGEKLNEFAELEKN